MHVVYIQRWWKAVFFVCLSRLAEITQSLSVLEEKAVDVLVLLCQRALLKTTCMLRLSQSIQTHASTVESEFLCSMFMTMCVRLKATRYERQNEHGTILWDWSAHSPRYIFSVVPSNGGRLEMSAFEGIYAFLISDFYMVKAHNKVEFQGSFVASS